MLDVRATIDRFKGYFGLQTDAELANRLEVPLGTLQSWKKRNAIPLEILVSASANDGVSIDWLMFGEKEKASDNQHFKINYELEFGCAIPAIQIVLEESGFSAEKVDDLMVMFDIIRDSMVSTVQLLLSNSRMNRVDAITAAEPAARQMYHRIRQKMPDPAKKGV